ncbi:MAG: hypothetical protein JNG83_05965 [Opitutaceae bacterium]|nr:hypothetical protein [Opitutaceae bacterium]
MLESPPNVPAGETWRYMLNYPFQVAPTLGGVHVNMKLTPGGPGQDFENGTDIILFDQLDRLNAANAIPVSRNHTEPNPNNGNRPAIIAKYPGTLGFVPFGAKRADGTPHPHAGTGFVLISGSAWPTDASEGFVTYPDRIGLTQYWGKKLFRPSYLYPLSYDGSRFQVGKPQVLQDTDIIPGYNSSMTGMTIAIADGDDLLVPQCARKPGAANGGAGVQRWRRRAGIWTPGEYEPVTPEDDAIEPSLIRDLDGSLLFLARGRRHQGPPLRVWRQARPGAPWELRINVNGLLNSTPISLNRAVDGTPFVVSNFYQPQFRLPAGLHSDGGISRLEPVGWRGERSTLSLWSLNADRDGFDAQFIARDPRTEFGLPPHGTVWAIDHPTSSPVRLADGQWHALMGYRLLEWKENTHLIPPSPHTGSYVDEIVSFGEPAPLWHF